jgi:hypothetical protein
MSARSITRAERAGWCLLPEKHLAARDVWLAQKSALEIDELGALALAKQFTQLTFSQRHTFVRC